MYRTPGTWFHGQLALLTMILGHAMYLAETGTKLQLRTFHSPDRDGCGGQYDLNVVVVVFALVQNWHNGSVGGG
jgi:hypothetical protein